MKARCQKKQTGGKKGLVEKQRIWRKKKKKNYDKNKSDH